MLYVTKIVDSDSEFIADPHGLEYDVCVSDTKTGRVGIFPVGSLHDRNVLGLEFDAQGLCILIVRFGSVAAKFQEYVKGVTVEPMSALPDVKESHILVANGRSDFSDIEAARLKFELPSGDWQFNCNGVVECLSTDEDDDWVFMPIYDFLMRIVRSIKLNIFRFPALALYSYDESVKYVIYLSHSQSAETFYTKSIVGAL